MVCPSSRDVELARTISAIAREHGLAADTTAIQGMPVIPGGPDTATIMPLWRSLLRSPSPLAAVSSAPSHRCGGRSLMRPATRPTSRRPTTATELPVAVSSLIWFFHEPDPTGGLALKVATALWRGPPPRPATKS